MSLFGEVEVAAGDPGFDERLPIPTTEFDKTTLLRNEKEMLGLYVSDHPLFGKEAALRRRVDQSIAELGELADRTPVRVGGVVTGLARRFTKRGDQMASFRLEDLGADIEVVLFPRTLEEHGHKLADDQIVVVSGRVNKRDEDRVSVSCEEIEVLTGLDEGEAPTLTVRIPEVRLGPRELDQLRSILSANAGASPVVLDVGREKMRLADEFRVDVDRVVPEIRMSFGHDAIVL